MKSIRTPLLLGFRLQRASAPPDVLTRRAKIVWTLGNLLMMVGVVMLLYVGGLYTTDEYGRYAARGDTDVPAPAAVAPPESAAEVEPAPFSAPLLNNVASDASEGQIVSALPAVTQADHRSTVTRIVIPTIAVDSKVIEVGWDEVKKGKTKTAVWQVAKYAVGQHKGSANPGENGNVVLAGHVGGYGKVFKNLFSVNPGDQITLYNNGQQYLYTVEERLLVKEEGVPFEQQLENAKLIAPTNEEVVTLVTCWPPSGPKKFSERIIVRAIPFTAATPSHMQSHWTVR